MIFERCIVDPVSPEHPACMEAGFSEIALIRACSWSEGALLPSSALVWMFSLGEDIQQIYDISSSFDFRVGIVPRVVVDFALPTKSLLELLISLYNCTCRMTSRPISVV